MFRARFREVGLVLALFTVLFLSADPAAAQSSASAALNKEYIGLWNLTGPDGWRSVAALNANGTCTNGDQQFGTWELEHDHFTMHFDGRPGIMDRYNLPISDGQLVGKTIRGERVSMVRRDHTAPAATYAALAGTWDFSNHNDGHRATVVFNADGTISENGGNYGYWLVDGSRLVMTFSEHHDWHDFYDLPLQGGVLRGTSIMHHALTLTRQGTEVAQAGNTGGAGTPAATTAAPKTAVAAPTGRGGGGKAASYFGSTSASGGAPVDLRPAALPTPAGLGVPPLANVIARTAGPAVTPAMAAASTPVPSVPTPAATAVAASELTPVGKWHWHHGRELTLTDKGAILEDANVVGQWRWTSKDKGELQIQWNGTRAHVPAAYTLSPHGHHLEGYDVGHKDRTFVEDKVGE